MTTHAHLLHFTLASAFIAVAGCGPQPLDVGSNPDDSEAGETNGSGASDPGSGANGSGANGSGANGSGGTLGVGANGTGANGSGANGSGGTLGVGANGSGGTLGVGSNPNVTTMPNPQCAVEPTPHEPLPEFPGECQEGTSTLQGTWSGYIQGGGYPDSGNISITLQGNDDALCGTITFGPPAELAPATDPTAWYPVDPMGSDSMRPVAGFTYGLAGFTKTGPRLVFGVMIAEHMQSWCELQTPVFDRKREMWSCTPSETTYHDGEDCRQTDPCTNEESEMSCAQVETCALNFDNPCICNDVECAANPGALRQAFDLRFDGDEATGQIDATRVVYLTRQ